MFLDPIPTLAIPKNKKWRLDGPLSYYSKLLRKEIVVESGFETDLASIPRIFQRILPVIDDHILASIVHDLLYFKNGHIPGVGLITRKTADKIFKEAMKVSGVSRWKRQSMYLAVRAGGGFVSSGEWPKKDTLIPH